MLLVCPSCNTRYVVPDTAIGISGRQVRCANCRHSWFQEGPELTVPPAPKIVAPAHNAPEQSVTESSIDDQTPSQQYFESFTETQKIVSRTITPVADETISHRPIPSFAETTAPPTPAAYYEDEPSRFAHEPPFKARRNPAKLWTMGAVAFAILVSLSGVAIWVYGVPAGLFSVAGTEPDLKIILNDDLELNQRADGTPFFIASGTIVNPTAQTQNVPPMLITLKDASGRSVYSWKMMAKTNKLAPGAHVDFSEARLDVPLAAAKISATWVLNGE